MSKAKIASKNNPLGRGKSKDVLYEGKKIKPVKIISSIQSFMGAEYEDSGDIVMDKLGEPISWRIIKHIH